MNFLSGAFLAALVAAAGPLIIHLLNRRRHRTVQWAAMDFLREAIRRNKRIVELRDWLLLALRTAAVILFVLAMARPFWTSKGEGSYRGQPVHAVLVVDNSLSMGHTQLDKTVLDNARNKAAEFIQALPKGSDVSIIPLCGEDQQVDDVYATKEDALEALNRIEVVDRAARASDGAELARRALKEASEVPTKRVVFIGDMQQRTWGAPDLDQYFKDMEDVQLVDMGPAEDRGNTSVAEFRVQDQVADADTPTTFVATISHQSDQPRDRVRVTLKIDDTIVEERFVNLTPDQNLKLDFQYTYDVAGTPSEPKFSQARLEIEPDNLAGDDFRTCVVPVVAQLPVLFIDQYGESENVRDNRIGETYPLRRMIAAQGSVTDDKKQLVDVRLRRFNQVTRDDLKDARLAVVAGVPRPGSQLVQDLREYVQQGGQVLIAAGGDFDPGAWTDAAWLDGGGILPAPLRSEIIGQLPPRKVEKWPTFRLASATCKDPVFTELNMSEQDRDDLLSSPFFYRAVGVDQQQLEDFDQHERERQTARRQALEELEKNQQQWAQLERGSGLPAEEAARRKEAAAAAESLQPSWLGWSNPLELTESDKDRSIDQLVARSRPQIMGRYDNDEVFAVRRQIGDGSVVMMTSGCFPVWNSIGADYSALIFDQMLRNQLAQTLPNHSLGPRNEIVVPIPAIDQAARFTLERPGEEEPQEINVEATSENQYGVIVRSLGRRGIYRIHRHGTSDDDSTSNREWTTTLAVNGPSDESNLRGMTADQLEENLQLPTVRWVKADEAISLEGKTYFGHDVWKYLMLGALACLLIEMILLTPQVLSRMTGAAAPPEAA